MPAAFDERLRGTHGLILGPDDYPLAAPVAHLAPKGCLDGFLPPNRFFGWAGFQNAPEGLQIRVVIKIGAEVVASGELTHERPDLMNVTQPAGFTVHATRALTHEEVASGALSAEAIAGAFRGPLHIPGHIATRSFDFVTLAYLSRASGWDRDDVSALIGYAEAEELSPGAKRKLLAMLAVLNKGSRSRRLEEIASNAAVGLKDGMVIGAAPSTKPLTDGEVVSRFESLGQEAEFGYVQQHFGNDSASLLRWASVPYELLIKGLQARFSGVGAPENTRFTPHWSDGEYATSDTRYDLTAHTFVKSIPKGEHAAEFAMHCKRVASLRVAFMESLEDSLRIFVRVDQHRLTTPQAHALFGELNKYGRNRLLIVRSDRGRDGEVEWLRPDLAIGHIRSISPADAMDRHLQFDSWIGMLRNALKLFAD